MKCGFKKCQKHKGVGGGDDPQLTPYTWCPLVNPPTCGENAIKWDFLKNSKKFSVFSILQMVSQKKSTFLAKNIAARRNYDKNVINYLAKNANFCDLRFFEQLI